MSQTKLSSEKMDEIDGHFNRLAINLGLYCEDIITEIRIADLEERLKELKYLINYEKLKKSSEV